MKGEGLPLSPLQGGGGTPCLERSFSGATSSASEEIFEIWPPTKWGNLSQNLIFSDFRGPNFSLKTSF